MSTRSSAEHRATYQSHSDDDDSAQMEHAVEDKMEHKTQHRVEVNGDSKSNEFLSKFNSELRGIDDPQHGLGLFNGGCPCKPELRDQPVLEGSGRPLHPPLCLGRQGENQLCPQLLHGPAELGWRPGGLIFRTAFEDSVPVGVQGEGYAAAPYQSLHQQEVTAGILMIAKEGARHTACGIVHREQDSELRSVLAQPPVVTAVQLDQHALPWHPLPAHPVLGRAPSPRTAEPRVDQDAPQRGPAHVEALSLTQ